MARYEADTGVVALRFLLCGPSRAGKSEVLARVRERVGSRSPDRCREWTSLPLSVSGAAATLQVELVEFDPIDAENARAEQLMRDADGVCFVADPRRERLRDNLIAYAWLLERLRSAGRAALPGVLLINRRAGGDFVAAQELESVVGSGRFPSFSTDALVGDEVVRSLLELLRRGATRAHGELALDGCGIGLSPLLIALDESFNRAVPLPAAAVEPLRAAPLAEDDLAPTRAPLLRYMGRLLDEQGRVARERRRLRDQATWLEEEAKRPVAFLRSLLTHLERQGTRLPAALEEAVAGGAEVLNHLEAMLGARARGALAAAHEGAARRRSCDLALVARQAIEAVSRELPYRRLRLDAVGLEWCEGDPDLLRALFWSLFAALSRSRRARADGATTVRVRASAEGRSLRLRVLRFGALRRGHGVEELLLARRFARRIGWRFEFVARRGGAVELRLEPRELPIGRASPPLPAFA